MPNLAFQFEVLNQVIAGLQAQGDSRAAILNNNKEFAVLGAMGPDLLRYIPVSPALASGLVALAPPLTALLATTPPPSQGQVQALVINTLTIPGLVELQANPIGAIYSLVFSQVVEPVWTTLNSLNSFINKLTVVVQAEDPLGLLPLISDVLNLQSETKSLKTQKAAIQQLIGLAGLIVGLPPWMEQNVAPFPAPTDPTKDRLSEFLRWHHTDAFAQQLLKSAGNDQETAYALGYLCHIAASVTAEPFVNNITGGPYRTHWWRNRLAGNFIDSWTFGFFETPGASMSGDNPTPGYDQWRNLCIANLQRQFNVGGLDDPGGGALPEAVKAFGSGNLGGLPNQLPAGFAQYLQNAVNAVYPAAAQPNGFSAAAFQNAYVGAFAVYWFMTSGSGPLGILPVVGAPPDNCATAPSWITSGATPTPQQASLNLNTPNVICAILLAILTFFETLAGDIPAGLATLAGAMDSVIDWNKLKCNLFWVTKTVVDAENMLRDLLVTNGLAYPPPGKLGTFAMDQNNQQQTKPAADLSGTAFCKTNSLSTGIADNDTGQTPSYPRQMDTSQQKTAELNFQSYPQSALEAPATMNFPVSGAYPNLVVNGSGLQNGGIMTAGPYPSRNQFFGDAVSNALDLIQQGPANLASYNLDGDRGYGWKTWNPQPGSIPSVPPVIDVQE